MLPELPTDQSKTKGNGITQMQNSQLGANTLHVDFVDFEYEARLEAQLKAAEEKQSAVCVPRKHSRMYLANVLQSSTTNLAPAAAEETPLVEHRASEPFAAAEPGPQKGEQGENDTAEKESQEKETPVVSGKRWRCDYCAQIHRKCDTNQPCKNCSQAGVECIRPDRT